jgi:predicted RNA-binding Zn-ribbon protein involved in translation (DUF1610 family)
MAPKKFDDWEETAQSNSLEDELETFYLKFRDEKACRKRLKRWRWPGGFKCPKCGRRDHYVHRQRKLFQCKNCGYQASLTAGTLFHRSKIELRKWFLLIYLMIRLGKRLHLTRLEYYFKLGSSRSVWGMKRKIQKELADRKNARQLKKLVDA